jgi:hypothetical protein
MFTYIYLHASLYFRTCIVLYLYKLVKYLYCTVLCICKPIYVHSVLNMCKHVKYLLYCTYTSIYLPVDKDSLAVNSNISTCEISGKVTIEEICHSLILNVPPLWSSIERNPLCCAVQARMPAEIREQWSGRVGIYIYIYCTAHQSLAEWDPPPTISHSQAYVYPGDRRWVLNLM